MPRAASRRSRALPFVAILLATCSPRPPGASRRAALQAAGPASIKIVPSEGQPPFCLAFTVSQKGVVRQLTMSPANESIPCKAGEPVGGTDYRIPPGEGRVRVHVVFSDRALDATPLAAQVHELGASPGFSAMDLRAPGQVILETLDWPLR
jgi:hypothetical protein